MNGMVLKIFTDGGSKGNPGLSSIGGIGYIDGKTVFEFKKSIGIATNNDAEYRALIEALTNIKQQISRLHQDYGDQVKIEFYSDSRLMVNQVNGLFKVKNGKIREYVLKIRTLEQEINLPITYRHVLREENQEADRLVNEV
jgi:ribonuclease HI